MIIRGALIGIDKDWISMGFRRKIHLIYHFRDLVFDKLITGSVSIKHQGLIGRPLPAAGMSVAVIYLDKTHHEIL